MPEESNFLYRWSHRFPARDLESWEERLAGDSSACFIFSAAPGESAVTVEAWLTSRPEADAVRASHGGRVDEVRDQNWAALEQATSHRRIIRIRDRLVVSMDDDPAFLEELAQRWPDRHLLIFPPEMAFGTGDHATTATCLRILVDLGRARSGSEWTLLDLGTGTGILAVAGHRLGARGIIATDYDPKAVEVARQAVDRHRIPRQDIDVREEDALEWTPAEQFDVVAANMFSTILIQIMGRIRQAVKPGGDVLLSGILATQKDEVIAALEREGLMLVRSAGVGKWVSLHARPHGLSEKTPS